MNEHGTRLLGLLCQPGIQIAAQNGIACLLRFAHLFIVILEGCSSFLCQERDSLTHDLSLYGSLFAEAGEDLLHRMSVHASAGHGLLSRFLGALNNKYFHLCLRQKVSSYTSRNASAYDYDIKFFFCHMFPLSFLIILCCVDQ